jgi:hypothetical protein
VLHRQQADAVVAARQRLAEAELRSTNAQIEYLLRRALREAAGPTRARGAGDG